MLRSALLLSSIFGVLLVTPATPAAGQTLLPHVSSIVGRADKPEKEKAPRCLPSVTLLCAADTVVSGAVDVIGGAAGAGVGMAADAALSGVVGWAASGAAWLVKAIGKRVERSTRPALGSAWFGRRYSAMRELAVSLSALFLLAACLQATVRRDLGMLLRACLVSLPLALLLTFAAVTLVELALALTDGLTAAALQGAGGDAEQAFTDLGEVLTPQVPAVTALPGLVLFLGSLLTALLALVVWIELILREAAIYVTVAFLPIGLVAITWQRTAHWARRLAEWLAAVILAKFTIAVTFAVAGSMLGDARGGSGGLTALLAGCAVLLVAAASPWVLLRLIPFAEQAAGGLHRTHLRGATSSVPGAAVTSLLVRQAMLKNLTAGGSSPPKPAQPGSWTPLRARSGDEAGKRPS